jgi:hypothetical protein
LVDKDCTPPFFALKSSTAFVYISWLNASAKLSASNWPISMWRGTDLNPPQESVLVAATFIGTGYTSDSLALDTANIGNRTVFVWPNLSAARSLSQADRLKGIERNMLEYSSLVGTLLKRDPVGRGEEEWLFERRSLNMAPVWSALDTGDSDRWCRSVVKNLVHTFLPEGSEFIQYGNCGEGGHVGACLAKTYGFGDDEIRLCASENDHMFAMHKDPAGNQWCIMDRWKLDPTGNYSCGVDVDLEKRVITYKGEPTTNSWFQKVTCRTLSEYLAGASL